MSYLRNYGYYANKQFPTKYVIEEFCMSKDKGIYITAKKWTRGTMRSGIVEYLKVVENGEILFEAEEDNGLKTREELCRVLGIHPND